MRSAPLVPTFVGDLVPRHGCGEVALKTSGAILIRWDDGAWTGVTGPDGDRHCWTLQLDVMPLGIEPGQAVMANSQDLVVMDRQVVSTKHRDHLPAARVGRVRPHLRVGHARRGLIAASEGLDQLDRAVLARYEDALASVGKGELAFPALMNDLVGAGSGLTPFADDLIVGTTALVAGVARTVPPPPEPVARDRLEDLERRTSNVSAWILYMAAQFRFSAGLVAFVAALAQERARAVDQSLDRLCRVGSTSGIGMALGVQLGCHHLLRREHAGDC